LRSRGLLEVSKSGVYVLVIGKQRTRL
jgi:hypothetical protein